MYMMFGAFLLSISATVCVMGVNVMYVNTNLTYLFVGSFLHILTSEGC